MNLKTHRCIKQYLSQASLILQYMLSNIICVYV